MSTQPDHPSIVVPAKAKQTHRTSSVSMVSQWKHMTSSLRQFVYVSWKLRRRCDWRQAGTCDVCSCLRYWCSSTKSTHSHRLCLYKQQNCAVDSNDYCSLFALWVSVGICSDLFHCYSIACDIIKSFASFCLSVCAPTVAILVRIWWSFAQKLDARKVKMFLLGSKSDDSSPILPQWSPL